MHDSRHTPAGAPSHAGTHDPNIRILRRVSTLEDYPVTEACAGPVRRVALIDTETTGTDPQVDEVIDVAVVIIEVDDHGEIVGIASAGQALRDPGFPLPEHITQLTGLTDDNLSGQSIDLDRLQRLIAGADVRIAHNCRFDIAFLESLMPGLVGLSWACSAEEFDWLCAGFDGRKLAHLLMQCGWFNAAHRAMADVISLLHVLGHRLPDGGTILGALLDRAARQTVRVEATGAPFDKRSYLKGRGYRWDPRAKTWWIEVEEHEQISETLWLQREIAPWGAPPRVQPMSWHERHR
jgi:DNA polymerase-3 subunit epsilon